MNLNQAGIDLIKQFESLRLHAYPDPGSGGEPYTIGYGHTGGVKSGDVCTREYAENTLIDDLNEVCQQLKDCITLPLNDNQFSALVSFTFNEGITRFKNSTMLKMINAGGIKNAANQFDKWVFAGDKVLPGLVTRREAEKQLYLS